MAPTTRTCTTYKFLMILSRAYKKMESHARGRMVKARNRHLGDVSLRRTHLIPLLVKFNPQQREGLHDEDMILSHPKNSEP